MRISDWSSDVCSSDLEEKRRRSHADMPGNQGLAMIQPALTAVRPQPGSYGLRHFAFARGWMGLLFGNLFHLSQGKYAIRSEEHTSELQSLMRISYAVFCLKKIKINTRIITISLILINE